MLSVLRVLTIGALGFGSAFAIHELHQHEPTPDGTLKLGAGERTLSAARTPPGPGGQPVRLPDDWVGSDIETAVAWYRFELDLKVPPNRLWGLYVPSLEMSPTFYVNGVRIGGSVTPLDTLPRLWNRPVYHSIPSGLLSSGVNVVAVRLAANGTWGRLDEIYLGPEETIRPLFDDRYFLRVTLAEVGSWSALILGLGAVLVGLLLRQSVYFWFAIFCMAWAYQAQYALTMQIPFSDGFWDLTIYISLGWLVTSGSLFTLRLFDLQRPRLERVLLVTAVIGPFVLLLPFYLTAGLGTLNLVANVFWQTATLGLGSYAMVLALRHAMTAPTLQVYLLAVAYVMALCLGIKDWMTVNGLGNRHTGLMLHFATLPVLTSFGAIILGRYVDALRQTTELIASLEARVAQKTLEIERQFQRTQALETANALTEERGRIVRDVHDGFGSQLIGLMGTLSVDDARERSLREGLGEALTDLRLMIDSLDPVDNDVLVALGLLRNRVQPQFDAADIEFCWCVADLPPVADLGPERTLNFLRIVQEALANVLKHAQATRLIVATHLRLEIDGAWCLAVTITDNGIGCGAAGTAGRGIQNMRYRARRSNLKVGLMPGPGHGTRVAIGFPLDSSVTASASSISSAALDV